VRVAYGHQWLPMIPVLSVLGIWISVRVLENSIGWLLASAGEPGLNVKIVACSYVSPTALRHRRSYIVRHCCRGLGDVRQ
jgi:O-antigen/teichoic acid export membrane protein